MPLENRDIKFIKGIGEKRSQLFKKRLGLFSLRDLLTFYPRAYEDWSAPNRICDITLNEVTCIKAKIATEIEEKISYRTKITTYTFYIYDRTGQIKVVIFNNKYLAKALKKDEEYLFYGKVKWNGVYREMDSPEIRKPTNMKIRPIYKATEGLSSRQIEKIIPNALNFLEDDDFLPLETVKDNQLIPRSEAIKAIHFPKSEDELKKARRRLAFDELFLLRIGFLTLKKRNRGNSAKEIKPVSNDEILKLFPFPLTKAQLRVIRECLTDMSKNTPMNRLIQGDVGSGKTAVAATLCFVTHLSGYGSIMLAPTEILASQHYDTMCNFFRDKSLNIRLLTGSITPKNKIKIKEELKSGKVDILIATHAVLTEDVELKNISLIITDEQHRFGVAQRATLSKKASSPHTLVMSATPIPRTMGLVIYGDLEISVIDELPKGRIPIESYHVGTLLRKRAIAYVKKHIDMGYQGYIICPAIEEDEDSYLTDVITYARELSEGDLQGYKIGVLHGKMKPKEKDKVMKDFSDNKIQLLVATTVVEVGVDVPNAVIMVVENAERFGLSQLHQLRGRVGRGNAKSTCIFISASDSVNTISRLKALCSTADGFKIAEEDLKQRGPGNFLGKEQHGLPNLKIADIITDRELLEKATLAADKIYKSDPTLSEVNHLLIRDEVSYIFEQSGKIEFN